MPTRRTLLARLAAGLAAGPLVARRPLAAPARPFDLQGHRGARGLLPENTLAGFAHALALGVTTLELDIAITRDGIPVISHDPRLNPDITRGPDGLFLASTGPAIADMPAAQLEAYDVGRIRPGTKYHAQFAGQQPVDGARIPRFDALAQMVERAGNDRVRFAIEAKTHPERPQDTLPPDAFARHIVQAIRRHRIAARSSILSFDWRSLQWVQRNAPDIETVYLTIRRPGFDNLRPGSPWTAGFDLADHGSVPRLIVAAGGRTWSCFHADLGPALLDEAHALGLQVLAWTVNDTARMATLIDMGVDGIVTDRPDLLRQVMAQKGMPLPVP